jgi:phage terminase large subunit
MARHIAVKSTSALRGLLIVFLLPLRRGSYPVLPGVVRGGKGLAGSDEIPALDAFPAALVASRNEVEMQITFKNRSVFQILGADQADRLRGTNPLGCAFDEYALMPGSEAWDLTRPILAENGGFAVFAFTPQGRNHAHALYEQARGNPEWFTTRKTVDDTRRDAPGEDGRPIITRRQIEDEITQGMPPELAEQEFYASFSAAVAGVYYAVEVERAQREGRIRRVPHDPRLPVTTAWDLGGGTTAIVFA